MTTITFNGEVLVDISGYDSEGTNHHTGPTPYTPLFAPPYKSVFVLVKTSANACIKARGIFAVTA
jgi:hypothetical protein